VFFLAKLLEALLLTGSKFLKPTILIITLLLVGLVVCLIAKVEPTLIQQEVWMYCFDLNIGITLSGLMAVPLTNQIVVWSQAIIMNPLGKT
jgi:hypothetical protein